jgi:hypothetical protein
MNGIELLATTLLHFLWQGVLIAAAYAALRRCASRPEVRYLLACVALAAMAASPVATWVALRPVSPEVVTVVASAPTRHAMSEWSGFPGDLPRFFALGHERIPSAWLSWVAAAWMAGVVVFWLRLLGGWIVAERLRRRQIRPAPHQWQQVFERLRARLRVSRPVRLLVSGLRELLGLFCNFRRGGSEGRVCRFGREHWVRLVIRGGGRAPESGGAAGGVRRGSGANWVRFVICGGAVCGVGVVCWSARNSGGALSVGGGARWVRSVFGDGGHAPGSGGWRKWVDSKTSRQILALRSNTRRRGMWGFGGVGDGSTRDLSPGEL